MKIVNFFAPLALIVILVLLIYFPSLNYYFLQDDWYVLNKVSQEPLSKFFIPRSDVIYYRPVGMHLYFYLSKLLFGLNNFAFHLTVFFFHIANTLLLFYILYTLFKDKLSAVLGSLIYGTSSIHFMTLSWLALSWNVFGVFFILISFIFYIKKKDKSIYKIFTFLFFLLALLATEFALIYPFFLMIFSHFFREESISILIKKNKTLFLSMILLGVTYLILRFYIYPIPIKGEYQIVIGLSSVKTLFWYLLWIFNIPEELKYQTIFSQLRVTQTLINDGTEFLLPTIVAPVLSALSFICMLFLFKKNMYLLVGSLFIFVSFLFPVLFLPAHTYPYYLTLPLIGLVLLISKITVSLKNRLVGISIILIFAYSWFFSSFLTVAFNRQTHWIKMEEALSKVSVKKAKTIIQNPANNSTITFLTNAVTLKPALMDQYALKVVFNNQTVTTKYHFDLETIPGKTDFIIRF